MEAFCKIVCVLVVVVLKFEKMSGDEGEMIKNIFILAGQSNMAGRGGAIQNFVWDGVVPEECKPRPDILRFNANWSWEVATEPLHRDIDVGKSYGVGPGMPFANHLLKNSNNGGFGSIGLVPCAIGDTSISEWSKGSQLYSKMLARTQAALLLSGGGTLKGILWYQGEKDTTNDTAPFYKARFQQFIDDVRSDLQLPCLPFIEVALDLEHVGLAEVVRKAQLETAAEVANVKCVDALGLAKENDGVHLTTPSQVKLGTLMAESFLQIPTK